MRTLSLVISEKYNGCPIKSILHQEWHLSTSLVKSIKWREEGILLNGSHATVRTTVHTGDHLQINITDPVREQGHIVPVDLPLDILYEDEDLLIINKPAGIAAHDAALTEETVTVGGAVMHYLGSTAFHPVNRLDRGVTGIMVIAKNGYMHARCMEILHTDCFRREYRGICEGIPVPITGSIDFPIDRDPNSVLKRCISPTGQESHTLYEVLQTGKEYSLLRLRPMTGRTHQLRLHCAAISHPLVGDWLYGHENKALIFRPALHSYELWLTHPLSQQQIHLTAPLPEDMLHLLQNDR